MPYGNCMMCKIRYRYSGFSHRKQDTKWWRTFTHEAESDICVRKPIIVGSDNGLSPGRPQAIIWTNAGILLTGPLETIFSDISIIFLSKCRLRNSGNFASASMFKTRLCGVEDNNLFDLQAQSWGYWRFGPLLLTWVDLNPRRYK